MRPTRAVLFDLGGTLYDYRTLEPSNRESLLALARWACVDAEPARVLGAYQESLRRVFRGYLEKPFYLHRDLFRDAAAGMLAALGTSLRDADYERYRTHQRARHDGAFALREGVADTLRELRARGLHLAIVSNIDEDQLTQMVALGGLAPWFDSILSSEQARSCKPDSQIFLEALRRAGCAAGEALFVGDSLPQDIAGANRVGLRSALLWHRDDAAPPDRDPRPHHVIRRIPDVLELV